MAHALDVERARSTLESLEADVRQEAGINQVPRLLMLLTVLDWHQAACQTAAWQWELASGSAAEQPPPRVLLHC